MKQLLYLLTGIACSCWCVSMLVIGIYTPLSVTYVLLHMVVLIGAVVLMIGGVMGWTSLKQRSEWITLIGATILVIYFVPAIVTLWHQYGNEQVAENTARFLFGLTVPMLVFASFLIAVFSKVRLIRQPS
jgi:hypothetical protein